MAKMNMYNVKELTEKVTQALANMHYDRKPQGLYEPIQYVLSLGGKRMRPVLMLMAYNMYKENVESVVPVALGLEFYHNFTLLHDDVMDRAEVRRGKPCVHKVWGDNTAILSGDNMLVMAYGLVAQCPKENLATVLNVFTETAMQIDEGQQYDMEFEKRMDVTEAEYIEMIRLKTSVLLACALKIGAILGGASSQDADALYEFGEKVGLAFQLQDDYLDVYGDFQTFGKAIGGDILCNKKTYMLINAYTHADSLQRAELERWLLAKEYDATEKISCVTRLYSEIGVDKMANERICTYMREAERVLGSVSLPEERKAVLMEWSRQMLARKK